MLARRAGREGGFQEHDHLSIEGPALTISQRLDCQVQFLGEAHSYRSFFGFVHRGHIQHRFIIHATNQFATKLVQNLAQNT